MLRFAFVIAAARAGRLFVAPGPGAPAALPVEQVPVQGQGTVYRLSTPQMRVQGEGFNGAPFVLPAAAAPLLVALPAYAGILGYGGSGGAAAAASSDGGILGTIFNVVLNVIVLGLLAFVGKNIFDLLAEASSGTAKNVERISEAARENKANAPAKPTGPIYDDFDYTYKNLSERVEDMRTRKKQSKQVTADGKRFAPWMNIDEDKVEQMKKNRMARKEKEKASASGGGPSFEPPKLKLPWE